MPAMTTVFRVVDPAWLDGLDGFDRLTGGDKLRFSANRIQGVITLTVIERAR